jgi:hypothetical protein
MIYQDYIFALLMVVAMMYLVHAIHKPPSLKR